MIMVVQSAIDKIYDTFPFTSKNNLTFDIFGDIEKTENKKYMIHIIDSEGYKYYLTSNNFYAYIRNECKSLNRFFKRNPYTYDNIRNFIKRENIRLELLEEKECSGRAREKLKFYDKEYNREVYTSWNELQNFTFQYRYGYSQVLVENKLNRTLSKEDVTKIIFRMQEDKGSSLTLYDFYPKQENCVGIRTIRKYWGELWIMQKELGLKIMGKHGTLLASQEAISEIDSVCSKIGNTENRYILTYSDFSSENGCTYCDLRRYQEAIKNELHITIREYLQSKGFSLQKAGCGMTYKFDDGEHTESKYEYTFSKILRSYGFEYGKTYFRTLKYSSIDNEYSGNMNCDYKIVFNDDLILYVELAGILGNVGHIECYKTNTPIKSKSKEEYRQKLIEKEKIFKRNNLDYLILLKPDMTEENFKNILEQYIKKVA